MSPLVHHGCGHVLTEPDRGAGGQQRHHHRAQHRGQRGHGRHQRQRRRVHTVGDRVRAGPGGGGSWGGDRGGGGVVLDDGGRQGGADVGVDGQCWGRGRGRGVVAERGGGEEGGGAVPRPAHLQGRGVEAVRGGEDGDDVALVLDTNTLHPTLHLHLHTTLSSWNLLSWGNLSLVANSLLVPARGRTEFLTVTGCHMVTMVTAGRTHTH